jgi:hypothetical protein
VAALGGQLARQLEVMDLLEKAGLAYRRFAQRVQQFIDGTGVHSSAAKVVQCLQRTLASQHSRARLLLARWAGGACWHSQDTAALQKAHSV